ncbi:MAG: hypothetical protein J2P53_10735 [Bradyrhizobiaceae bacterium]|nr:hypothetical protein [Bradyrhizobiaceae bacterium]
MAKQRGFADQAHLTRAFKSKFGWPTSLCRSKMGDERMGERSLFLAAALIWLQRMSTRPIV